MTEPKRRRILLITEHFPPQLGGMAESCSREVQALRRQDHIVDVCLFHAHESPVRLKERVRDNGVDFLVSYPDSIGNAVQKAWQTVQLRDRVEKYDLVIGFGCNSPGLIATTLAAWFGIPSAVMIRGNDLDRDWFDPRRHAVVEQALSRAGVVGTVTKEKMSKVQALFPGKQVIWTPNGVDPSQWDCLPHDIEEAEQIRADLTVDGRRVIGVFGELKYKKRIPFWLEAIRDAGVLDKLALLVVGRMDDELTQILADPALAPISRHMSFRTRESLPALYHACDYVAIPSLFEGFPNVLLESMACGVVPICSDAGAMCDVIEHGKNGFIFPVEDRAAAGRATRDALALSCEELGQMKTTVRQFIGEQFSTKRELQTLLDMIELACR